MPASNNGNINAGSRNYLAFLLLCLLVFLVYSNTFDASWHFDDYPHIVNNQLLHINDLLPKTLVQTLSAPPSGHNPDEPERFYRPLSCLTFAVNWYFCKEGVAGYHLINIVIHCLTGFILFLTVLNLFESPNLKGTHGGSRHFIALLTAVLWVINPIQTQAVTYIVQRMASLAAMFYILSIYLYLRGRTCRFFLRRSLFFAGCLFSFCCALGSKETPVTLPAALFLVEIIFFQDPGSRRGKRISLWFAAGCAGLLAVLGYLVFFKDDPLSLFKGYEWRSFTLKERLMTEPRVLVLYLSQIFFPLESRLSFVHDITTSTSLIAPWTTLPAILLVLFLICIGLHQIKIRPLVSFSILFFFLTHILESTIIPLELVFEHRNYLPSLFLFLPVSCAVKWMLDYLKKRKSIVYYVLVSLTTLTVASIGIGTYVRNMTWGTEKSLWEDAMAKAPMSARPPHNLAKEHYERIGRFDIAMRLYERALQLRHIKPEQKAFTYNNMGNIYEMKGEMERAGRYYNLALTIDPSYENAQYNLILSLARLGKWDEASMRADLLLSGMVCGEYLILKGVILLNQKGAREAIPYFIRALKTEPNDGRAMFYLGVAFCLAGEHDKAERYLSLISQAGPKDIFPHLWLIENSLRAGRRQRAFKQAEKLLSLVSPDFIEAGLMDTRDNSLLVRISPQLIAPVIAKALQKRASKIAGLNKGRPSAIETKGRLK